MGKPYTTYEQQIEILKSKRLIISDDKEVMDLLKRCSYFGLVTGYKNPFKDKKGFYKVRTTIHDIYALYTYDMELRELFLKYILIIENHIKSLISYAFCDSYGDMESNYLNATNYDYTIIKQDGINKFIGKLREVINDSEKHAYLQHQKKRHGNIPLWALIRALTIGVVSKMYSFLKPQEQTMVSKEFECVTENELAQMIDLLSRFRNVCAHNERLYDYKYNKGGIQDTDVHSILNIKRQKNRYVYGKNDLFAVVIVFKYLLSNEDFSAFIDSLKTKTKELLNKTNILQEAQILKLMGFPNNWDIIRDCSKARE